MNKQIKKRRESIDLAAQAGAASEVVDRYGSAAKQHLVAYSGKDNETGKTLSRGLKKISRSKVHPEYESKNIKQQAGFAAEEKYTARQNAEKIISKENTRYSRTDDLGSVNDQLFDHKQIDLFGEEIAGSGEQMKFVGSSPKQCLNKLASQKFEKYLDADATITVPSDYYDEIITEADKKIGSLKRQLEHARSNGNSELADSLEGKINKYEKIKSSVKDSGITNKEAIEARMHPKISTAKDVARISHRAGLEQAKWGAGISGGISLIRNIVDVARGNKEPKDAAMDVVKDAGTGAVAAYTTAFAGTAIKGAIQNAGSSSIRAISNTNVPAAIVTSTIDIGKSIKKYIKGETSGLECLTELGEKGTGHMSAAMFAAVGQAAIPIPVVGAAVGSMVGYALSSAFYKELVDSLKEAKLAKEQRIQIEAECAEARTMIAEYRTQAEQIINEYFQSHIQVFSSALSEMDQAVELGDIDQFISANAAIQIKLNYKPSFTNKTEFDSLMESDQPFKF